MSVAIARAREPHGVVGGDPNGVVDQLGFGVEDLLAGVDLTLIRTALAGSGDIITDTATNTLHIRLDPLSAPRHTAAIAELCHALNDTDTDTVYPGTGLTLRYSIKPHR